MFLPLVVPGMKEANDFSAIRIKAGQIRSLETVAVDTSEREILWFTFAPVLACNDVIYLERRWVKS
jgi:hypothetical protein